MILIKPSFEIIEQEPEFEGVLKQIEKVGRTCYKSEDKIKEGSAKKFVDMLTTNCHGAMLEHGTVYFKVLLNNELVLEDAYGENNSASAYNRYINNKYSKVNCRDGLENVFITDTVEPGYAYITTNYRVLVENGWLDDLKYQCEPTEYHAKRVTVKFVTDQGVLREFTRHRVFSFAVESTRYCNYGKDKFGNEVSFIIPTWCNGIEEGEDYDFNGINNRMTLMPTELSFLRSLRESENTYMRLLDMGWKPEQARNVLPLATKCEMIMTGFIEDWEHFFELRCDTAAHPQARELAIPLMNEFIRRELI
jgi:thymidylate synthase (FAD)